MGINCGGYAHVLAAVLGLSAILATSAVAFTVVKIIGAGYLVWLGIRTFASASRGASEGGSRSIEPASDLRIFCEGFLSDALNPKVSIFFLAFLPQFVDRTSSVSVPMQLLLLGVACNVIALTINVLLVLFASRVSRAVRARSALRLWLNRMLGGLFLALGLRLATEKL